jgi:hypothetical protein
MPTLTTMMLFRLFCLSITAVKTYDLPLTARGSERISRTIGRIPAAALSKLKASTALKLALPCIDRLACTSCVTCLNDLIAVGCSFLVKHSTTKSSPNHLLILVNY